MKDGQRKIEITIENDIKPEIKVLFEGYKQVYEKLQEHDKRFDSIDEKLEKHDVKIQVIQGGKAIK